MKGDRASVSIPLVLPWQLLSLPASWRAVRGERTYLATSSGQDAPETLRAAEISLRFVFGIFIEMTLDIVKQQSKKQSVDAHDVLAVYTDYLQNTKNIQNFAGKITFNKKI